MNKNSYIIILLGFLIISVLINILSTNAISQYQIDLEVYRNEIERLKQPKPDNEIHFIWNDDEESIPKDGEKIQIEFTDENNVFIGPIE